MPSTNEQARLVSRVARGDLGAFTEIYNLYRDRVFGFAVRMVGDREVAEDLTHEAFVVLIEHPERYKPERGSVLTFLCAVTRNQILLHWRRRGYQLEEQLENNGLLEPADEARGDPLSDLLARELTAVVATTMDELPPLQREAIILREYQELTYQEIATVTGTTVDVVRMRLRRARQSLLRTLSHYVESEEGFYELHRGTTKSRSCA